MFAVVGECIALVGEPLALVRQVLARGRRALSSIEGPIPLVEESLTLRQLSAALGFRTTSSATDSVDYDTALSSSSGVLRSIAP